MTHTKLVLCAYGVSGSRILEHILDRHDIADIAVFTHVLPGTESEVMATANRSGVYCSTRDVSQTVLPFAPDVVASVGYRNIISESLIDSCSGRIFNAHPSLLPRHRGCSSVPWAIIEGDHVTGVTFHYIDKDLDTGRIILQYTTQIRPGDTQASLYARCTELTVECWPAAFLLVMQGFPGVPQVGESCYHRRGAPYGGAISEDWDIETVERFIRAMTFPPLPYATFRGREVRTLETYLAIRNGASSPADAGDP